MFTLRSSGARRSAGPCTTQAASREPSPAFSQALTSIASRPGTLSLDLALSCCHFSCLHPHLQPAPSTPRHLNHLFILSLALDILARKAGHLSQLCSPTLQNGNTSSRAIIKQLAFVLICLETYGSLHDLICGLLIWRISHPLHLVATRPRPNSGHFCSLP